MTEPISLYLLTDVASTEGYVVSAVLFTLFFALRKEWHRVRAFVLTAIGLTASVSFTKLLVAAPRPTGALIETTGYAFPSGHAAGVLFITLAACIIARCHLRRAARYAVYAVAITIAVVVGASRVYYGVHTPTQVFAGYAFGLLWILVFVFLSRKHL